MLVLLDMTVGVGLLAFGAVLVFTMVFGKIGFETNVATKSEMYWGRGCFVCKARGWLRRV